MIIYRPEKELLADSMVEAVEFKSANDMIKHIVKVANSTSSGKENLSENDIIITSVAKRDPRAGWWDSMNVCTKRYGEEDYMETHGAPKLIGVCATTYIPYDKKFWENQQPVIPTADNEVPKVPVESEEQK